MAKQYEVTAKRRDGYPGIGCNGRYFTTGVPVILNEEEMGGEIVNYRHLLDIRLVDEPVTEPEPEAESVTVKTTPRKRRRKITRG